MKQDISCNSLGLPAETREDDQCTSHQEIKLCNYRPKGNMTAACRFSGSCTCAGLRDFVWHRACRLDAPLSTDNDASQGWAAAYSCWAHCQRGAAAIIIIHRRLSCLIPLLKSALPQYSSVRMQAVGPASQQPLTSNEAALDKQLSQKRCQIHEVTPDCRAICNLVTASR